MRIGRKCRMFFLFQPHNPICLYFTIAAPLQKVIWLNYTLSSNIHIANELPTIFVCYALYNKVHVVLQLNFLSIISFCIIKLALSLLCD